MRPATKFEEGPSEIPINMGITMQALLGVKDAGGYNRAVYLEGLSDDLR